ncbi:MAG: hypothetical protein P4K83_02690 [Terracidiphilus sp.]|nr:hypothetical protein [Terracidiphilus sp.]
MDGIDMFLELPIAAQAAVICFVACASGLFVVLLAAPQRNFFFFFRWRPQTRFLALLASPALLILWPIVLYGAFLKSRGIGSDDLDFGDD